MIVNFIKDNRFPKFINKLTSNSLNQTDSTYVDTSPNGIFDGDIGTVLIKDGIDILYKTNTDTEFTNLSSYFQTIVNEKSGLLTSGINKKATWIKNSSSTDNSIEIDETNKATP
jgi:hypothetical protein